jgi:hypothetical protein
MQYGDLMQKNLRFVLIPIAMLLITAAVSGFSISSANYTLSQDGSGTVDLQYQLNETEQAQYDLINKLMDLKTIGKEELKRTLNRDVVVMSLSPQTVQLKVENISTINGTAMSTPSFTYVPVESLVDPSLGWIVQKFKINFVPHTSTIVFPDGYQETFTDAGTIPAITHQVSSGNQS